MRTLERRLQVLEQQQTGPEGFEIWIGGDDGRDLLGPNGKTLSRADFDVLYPDAIVIGRDGEGSDDESY